MIEADKITQEDLDKYISCSLNMLYERDHYLIYHKVQFTRDYTG